MEGLKDAEDGAGLLWPELWLFQGWELILAPLASLSWGQGGRGVLGPGGDSLLPLSVHLQLHGVGTCVWLPG